MKEGEHFVITTRDIVGNVHEVGTTFHELPSVVKPYTMILIDDGALELKVESVYRNRCYLSRGSRRASPRKKGHQSAEHAFPIPSLTEKDRVDLEWAMGQNVDYIALSFVRKAEDCREVKDLIKEMNKREMGRALLVAKIEKAEAIENLDAIVAETDGVMVARGDLGVETSVELVPVYQKRIIEKAVANDKFVITATQMLQSMVENPYPTRAEASDVANAVWDGSDAVMLSAETATGRYPIETVKTMARIIDAAETIKPAQLKKPVKFVAACVRAYKPGPVQGRHLRRQGADNGKGRGIYGVGLNGPAPVELPLRAYYLRADHLARCLQPVVPDLGSQCLHTRTARIDRAYPRDRRKNFTRRRGCRTKRDDHHDGRPVVRFGTIEFCGRLDDRREDARR